MPANARIRRLISKTSTAPRPPARARHASGKDGDCQDEHLFNPPHTDTLSQIQRDIIASSLCRSSASAWMLYTACSLNPNSAKCCMRPRKKFHLPRARGFLAWHYARAARADSAQSDYCQYRSKKMRTPIRAQIQRVSSRKVPSTVSPSTGSARRASFLCFLEFSETCSTIQFFLNCARKKNPAFPHRFRQSAF